MTKKNYKRMPNNVDKSDKSSGNSRVSNVKNLDVCVDVVDVNESVKKIRDEDVFVRFLVSGGELSEDLRTRYNVQGNDVDPVLVDEVLRLVSLSREIYCKFLDQFEAFNKLRPLGNTEALNAVKVRYLQIRMRLLNLLSDSMQDSVKKRLADKE